MRPENAARTLAMIGASLLILVALMRLLSVYLLISDPRLQAGAVEVPGPDPALGLYAFSNDGRQVRFERGIFSDGVWQGGVFTLNLPDSSTMPGDLPAVPTLYEIENGQVRLNQESANPQLTLSPGGLQITETAYSADGQALALVHSASAARQMLYAIRGLSPAELIAESSTIRGVAWSPDQEQLVYVASIDGGEDVFAYSFIDRQAVRLTDDEQAKSSPIFSRDGRLISFLAEPVADEAANTRQQTPTPLQFQPMDRPAANGADIYLMDADGGNLRQLTNTPQDETLVAWTVNGEVAYSVWQPHWPAVAHLYAISPEGAAQRRLYPPVAIEAFTCQPVLPGGSQVDVAISVSNHSVTAVTVPIEVSADRQPLDLITSRSQHRVQREEISLPAGETRTLEWQVDVPEDIRVYLAGSIETGVEFPISAEFCEVTPRQMFLPRLPLLRTTLIIGLLGSIVCLPWLRHTRRIGLWLLGGSYWVLLWALILVESWILLNS